MADSGSSKIIMGAAAAATAVAAAAAYFHMFGAEEKKKVITLAEERAVQTGESLLRGGVERKERPAAVSSPLCDRPKGAQLSAAAADASQKRKHPAENLSGSKAAAKVVAATPKAAKASYKVVAAKVATKAASAQAEWQTVAQQEQQKQSRLDRIAAEKRRRETDKAHQRQLRAWDRTNAQAAAAEQKVAAEAEQKVLEQAAAEQKVLEQAAAEQKVLEQAAAEQKAAKAEAEAEQKTMAAREADLQTVFDQFDLDGSGYLTKDELFMLGSKRRELGQIAGVWTEDQNERLLAKMDKDGDGKLDSDEFCGYFAATLSRDDGEFKSMIGQFMQVANNCRAEKQREAIALQQAAEAEAP